MFRYALPEGWFGNSGRGRFNQLILQQLSILTRNLSISEEGRMCQSHVAGMSLNFHNLILK